MVTGEERMTIRKLIDARLRLKHGLIFGDQGHGYENKYKHGCRCDACKRAATEARKRRRQSASMTPRQRELGLDPDIWGTG